MDKEIVVELAKKAPVEDIYKDGLQPAVKELGVGLGKAIKLVLAPITALAWGYDKISAYLDFAIPTYFESRNIGKEKIIAPDVATAIPAIEAMRYTKDEIRNANQGLKGGRKTAQKSIGCKNVANKPHQALLRCL